MKSKDLAISLEGSSMHILLINWSTFSQTTQPYCINLTRRCNSFQSRLKSKKYCCDPEKHRKCLVHLIMIYLTGFKSVVLYQKLIIKIAMKHFPFLKLSRTRFLLLTAYYKKKYSNQTETKRTKFHKYSNGSHISLTNIISITHYICKILRSTFNMTEFQ